MDSRDWEMLSEVNVIKMWPTEKKSAVTSAKWSERKEGLEALLALCEQNPRLSTESMTMYGEIMDELKKILIKDSNVNVVAVAIRLLTALALGLGRNFGCFVSLIWVPLLEKTKEKKPIVKDQIGDCLDAVGNASSSDRLTQGILEVANKPNPQSRVILNNFLYRLLNRQEASAPPIPFLKDIIPLLIKQTGDGDADVRDSACQALGSAKRLLGPAMNALLGPIANETNKMAKIAEACERARKEVAEAISVRRAREENEGGSVVIENGDSGVSESSPSTNAVGGAAVDPWSLLDPVDVFGLLPRNFEELLTSKKWQERKEALECLEKILKEKGRVEKSPDSPARFTQLVKVLEKDVNVNVAALAASSLTLLAASMRTDFAPFAGKVLAAAFEKFKEKKPVLRDRIVECVDAVSFTTPLDEYTEQVLAAFEKTNPTTRAQTAAFVARLLSKHSTSTVPRDAVKTIVPGLVKLSSDGDADVRDAAFQALGALLRCVGDRMGRMMMGNELTEDKIKIAKIEEQRDVIEKERGPGAAEEIKRLHSRRDSHGHNGETHRVEHPLPAVRAASSRPATAASRVLTSESQRILTANQKPKKLPGTFPLRVEPKRPATVTGNSRPLTTPTRSSVGAPRRPESSQQRIGGPRSRLGSREALNALPTEDAAFTTVDGKTARLAENRPTTSNDLVKLAMSCCTPSLQALLKTEDFQQQLRACDVLERIASDPTTSSSVPANSDIVIRWLALRAQSNNPMLLDRLLPLASRLIVDIDMCDAEIAILTRAVLTKVGETKENIRNDAKALLFTLAESCGAPNLLPYFAESLTAKSFRQRQETIDMLSSLLRADSCLLSASSPRNWKKLILTLCESMASKDALLRTHVLNVMVVVDAQLKEDPVYRSIIDKLPSKERSLLSDRLLRASYGAGAPRPLAPLPRPTTESGIPRPGSGLAGLRPK